MMREMDPLSMSRGRGRGRNRSRSGVPNREHWVSKHRQHRVHGRSKQHREWDLVVPEQKQGSERRVVALS